jgi:hypothetical protein
MYDFNNLIYMSLDESFTCDSTSSSDAGVGPCQCVKNEMRNVWHKKRKIWKLFEVKHYWQNEVVQHSGSEMVCRDLSGSVL